MSNSIEQNSTVAGNATSANIYREDRGLNWLRPDEKKLRRSIFTDLTCSVLPQDILYYCPGCCWRRHLPPSPTTTAWVAECLLTVHGKLLSGGEYCNLEQWLQRERPSLFLFSVFEHTEPEMAIYVHELFPETNAYSSGVGRKKKVRKSTESTVSLARNYIFFWHRKPSVMNLMSVGPCIIVITEE